MAEAVRIVGHKRSSTDDSEGLQAQVMPNGALLVWEEGYMISDTDDSNATYKYYGFVDREGRWYIQRKEVGTNTATFRYCAGTTGYSLSWTGKAALSYDYWYNTF